MNKKLTVLIISTVIMITAIVLIGPMDIFAHGYFCDEIAYGKLQIEDFEGHIPLADGDYEMVFSPQKDHFAGFEINLVNQPDDNYGEIVLYILNDKGDILDTIPVDLSKVTATSWYKLYTNARLKMGENYTLRFVANECDYVPYLQTINSAYLPSETITGNVLICYAYAESTFTFQNKVLFGLFLAAIWGFICSLCLESKYQRHIRAISTGILAVSILAWNYMYNSMDNQNNEFKTFQADSEALVTGAIYAAQDGMYCADETGEYGLGRYYDLKGWLGQNDPYISDDSWINGYSRTQASIIVNSNVYSRSVAVPGNYILFKNGEMLQISNIEDNGRTITVYLNSDSVLTPERYGSLDDVTIYSSDYQILPVSGITAYESQYGLHGKVFKYMAGYMEEDQVVSSLRLICCIITASVFAAITAMISAKYNNILAGCFFVTFWISPWIVNFARNLYWVEFTWFLPMAAGLFCAWKIGSRKCRICSYVAAFITVFVKCLCGYEYISTIMMGMISFLLVDLILALVNKDKQKGILLVRTIIIIGIMALFGFGGAICVHAPLRAEGNILEGIKDIFEKDVLRRTSGGNLNDFDPGDWPSFNASVWAVYCRYFRFPSEIITGVKANLFPLLCVIPLFIFGYECYNKKPHYELMAMYVVFFLSSISWFCLAKSHSYVHPHMNYVMWYFGFVQICFYIIVSKIAMVYKNDSLCKNDKSDRR